MNTSTPEEINRAELELVQAELARFWFSFFIGAAFVTIVYWLGRLAGVWP